MSAGFTPGPWRTGIDGNNRVYGPNCAGEHTGLIAVVYKGRANMDLIAAAPELYEALSAVIGRVEHAANMFHNSQQWHEEDAPDGSGTMWDWVFAPAHAAIAKVQS